MAAQTRQLSLKTVGPAEQDEMLEEATGLSADYREVRRLRRLLAAARAEATTALAEAQSPGRGRAGSPRRPCRPRRPARLPGSSAARRPARTQTGTAQSRLAQSASASSCNWKPFRSASA